MEELRKKVAARIDAGDKIKDIAKRFLVSRQTVYKVKNMFMVSDNYGDCPGKWTTRTEATVAAVKAKIDANPRSNIRKIAKELNINKNAVSRITRNDWGMASRACQPKSKD